MPDETSLDKLSAIEMRSVCKHFAAVRALDHINLRIATGSTTVLIGPSGCGKSTILRLVIGLTEPDAGEVYFEGQRVGSSSLSAARQRMGYVIQEGGLFPHLTAWRNVTLAAEYSGWPESRRNKRVRELAELVHLKEKTLLRYPAQLSGGQRQRVSLMRALMLDPDVLLLDEPLGALDPLVRARLQDELREIFRRLGKTVVLVTHDLTEAAFLGDTIVLMNKGGVVQSGAIADLLEKPADAFVTKFIRAQRRELTPIAGDEG